MGCVVRDVESNIWGCFEMERVPDEFSNHVCRFVCMKCYGIIERNMIYGDRDELTLNILRDHILVHIYEKTLE